MVANQEAPLLPCLLVYAFSAVLSQNLAHYFSDITLDLHQHKVRIRLSSLANPSPGEREKNTSFRIREALVQAAAWLLTEHPLVARGYITGSLPLIVPSCRPLKFLTISVVAHSIPTLAWFNVKVQNP